MNSNRSTLWAFLILPIVLLLSSSAFALDTDGDGIWNEDEINVWGTDPGHADTDSDTLNDWTEIFIWHSNPLLPDSNGDGTSDGAAVALGWDPNHVNVDGDGFLNGSDAQPTVFNGNGGKASVKWTWTEGAPNPINGVTTALGVNPATGELITRIPVLSLPLAGSRLELNLTHRARVTHDGPVGMKWTMECFARIIGSPTTNITLLDGRGHAGAFTRTGTGTWSTPAGWYCTISYAGSQYTVAWPQGEKWYFDTAGKLIAVTNRNGVGYTCSYDASANMTTLMTTFGQVVTFEYYASRNRVYRITDFYNEGGVQRRVRMSFSSTTSDLLSLSLPGTAQHNYEGPTYNFTYSSNRIYQITAADGQKIRENTYNSSSKCLTSKLGDNLAGTNTFVYATGKTTLTSPLANQTEFYFSGSSPLLSKIRELTRGIRPGDPAFFETLFAYNNQCPPLRNFLQKLA